MTDIEEFRLDNEDCERFLTLIESRLVEEKSWGESDGHFYIRHKSVCVECSRYDEMLSSLTDYSDTPPSENVTSQRTIRQIVDLRFAKIRFRRRALTASAASVLIGGLIALFFALANKGVADEEIETFDLSKGALVLGGRSIGLGERFAFKALDAKIPMNTLIEIPSKLYIAMEKDARIDFVEHRDAAVRFRLRRGRAAVHLVPGSKIHVQVEVDGSVVEVKGTVFIVEAGDEMKSVQVIRGAVKVSRTAQRAAAPQTVEAGFKWSFKNAEKTRREPLSKDPLLALLGITEAPLNLPVKQKLPSLDAASLESESDADIVKNQAGLHLPAQALLRAANECRASANWKCAEENFVKVISYYPTLPDAATAMLPLAEILLDNLERPRDALQYFKRYQKRRPTSGLGQEALFGECRSLEKMGRATEEKACLEKYLAKYPNSLYTQMAKTRLIGIMVKD